MESGERRAGKIERWKERDRDREEENSEEKKSLRMEVRVKSEVEREERRQVRTPAVLRMKVKRLESGMKVIDGGSPIGKSPRRKGRHEKGTVTTDSGSGKISSIIQMF